MNSNPSGDAAPSEKLADEVHIHLPVVVNIVKMAAIETEGIQSVSDRPEGLLESLGARKGERGVEVEETQGSYHIRVHLQVYFGFALAKVAQQAQQRIREQVERMTGNKVAKIDVFIDNVQLKTPPSGGDESWEGPHSD